MESEAHNNSDINSSSSCSCNNIDEVVCVSVRGEESEGNGVTHTPEQKRTGRVEPRRWL